MRKHSAILLFSVFVLFQHAKQAIYLECSIANKYKSPAQQCDCEKKAGFDKSDSNKDPLSKNHTHIHLEELFQFVKENTPHFGCTFLPGKKYGSFPDDLCEGITVELFHPPCA
ncbi:MAG: hypothetical protein JNK27_07115 [Chitinophagaceae bacterium]|nr:hypothetical protein [Chitinophagaceae bacterium]